MNDGDSDMVEASDEDQEVDDELSGGEGDVDDFFDDETEEVGYEDTEMDNSKDDDLSSKEEDISGNLDISDGGYGFDFREHVADVMNSDGKYVGDSSKINLGWTKEVEIKELAHFCRY